VSESQLACHVRHAMPPLSSPIFLPRAQDVNAESPPWEPSTQLYTEPCRSCHLWTHRSLEVLRVHRPHLSSAVELRVQVEQPSVSSTTVFPRCRPVAKTRRVPLPRASAPLFQSFTSELHLMPSPKPPFRSQCRCGWHSSRYRYHSQALRAH
jgi:hypothetical protein